LRSGWLGGKKCTGRLIAVLLGRLKAALFVETSRKRRGEGMLAKWWQNSACQYCTMLALSKQPSMKTSWWELEFMKGIG
jgi:hypothetical protein